MYRILRREGPVKRQETQLTAAIEYHTKTMRPLQIWATDALKSYNAYAAISEFLGVWYSYYFYHIVVKLYFESVSYGTLSYT